MQLTAISLILDRHEDLRPIDLFNKIDYDSFSFNLIHSMQGMRHYCKNTLHFTET